eukprot:341086-Lingulodinium_polyedra.AAC.1
MRGFTVALVAAVVVVACVGPSTLGPCCAVASVAGGCCAAASAAGGCCVLTGGCVPLPPAGC